MRVCVCAHAHVCVCVHTCGCVSVHVGVGACMWVCAAVCVLKSETEREGIHQNNTEPKTNCNFMFIDIYIYLRSAFFVMKVAHSFIYRV